MTLPPGRLRRTCHDVLHLRQGRAKGASQPGLLVGGLIGSVAVRRFLRLQGFAGRDEAGAKALDLFTRGFTDVESVDDGAEPAGRGDRLQAGDARAEGDHLGRLHATSRRDQHRQENVERSRTCPVPATASWHSVLGMAHDQSAPPGCDFRCHIASFAAGTGPDSVACKGYERDWMESAHEVAAARFSFVCDVDVSGSWACLRTTQARSRTGRSWQATKVPDQFPIYRVRGVTISCCLNRQRRDQVQSSPSSIRRPGP